MFYIFFMENAKKENLEIWVDGKKKTHHDEEILACLPLNLAFLVPTTFPVHGIPVR